MEAEHSTERGKSEPFKNALGRKAVQQIGKNFERVWPEFPKTQFVRLATRGLDELELKARVGHVMRALNVCLPASYPDALSIVLAAAERWEQDHAFVAWPMIEWVGEHGLDHFDASLEALSLLTPLFTGEFAIRAFIAGDRRRALSAIQRFARSESEHVRRLASEGTRPRLPWGRRLGAFIDDPSAVLALLETLKDDPSEYVRRSVANNLNDISKDHPERVVAVCRRWAKRPSAERLWIIGRALRSLVKQGHPGALAVLGFDQAAGASVSRLAIRPARIPFGGSCEFSFTLESRARAATRYVVDYAVHHVKKNGERVPKVFKLATVALAPGQAQSISKRHSFRPITTRRYYAGPHLLEILVNGRVRASKAFQLLPSRGA